ncbi:FAD-dependent oxidoreductase [Ramlibacter alkalitolerans]|uniref:FAD-dependent oxidoreductase n=1 Tax=Ramlibacter alkalitolerans TaxID=2039631 RepID=A0ABS1JHD3_9BURK|nr:FAD-dependent oxidoreductase [Ramlibacter alkalitolerans]MBL0423624.1 FAD-dependent oxidoreductase [Ramlibacter alkalitolerans]
MNIPLPPTAWTTGTTEVFKTGTWRAALPQHVARPSPCHQACPVNGHIAEWIGHARTGDLRRAWEVLTLNNPFPAVAGRICHHPCETSCNRAGYDEAVSVCRLERAVGDAAIAAGWAYAPPAAEQEAHVAVVGGGPSGLSAAYQLRRRGWRVSLYEAKPRLGGLLRYGIPSYRLPRHVLNAEIARILELGVALHLGAALQTAADLERLRAEHDVVYLALGAARPKVLPQLPPEAPWSMQGAEYLARCAAGDVPQIGRRVVVIGGGSSAMDVARSARRNGCDVTVLALEARAALPAQREEVQEALEEGVVLCDGAMLQGVSGDGPLTLDCVHVRFQPGAAGAAPRIDVVEAGFTLAADAVLTAIGQDAELSLFPTAATSGGLLQVDARQASSLPGVWAGGDLASMARFFSEAVGMGKRAAIDIDRALRGVERSAAPVVTPPGLDEIATWYYPKHKRPEQRRVAVAERLASGEEVQVALSPDEVQAEASRCFSCGSCTSCDNCFQFCPDLAVAHGPEGYSVLADYCKGCGLCVRECPTGSMILKEELR